MADAVAPPVCINDTLTDDELRSILSRLESDKDKEVFGLVCKRWLHLQSTERKKLSARAGSHMLSRMAARFTRVLELDLSQSVSRSFYPGVTDSDLAVIAEGFKCLKVLKLQNCKAITDRGLALIGGGLPSLQSLDASYCRKLTDKGLSAVADGCHDLRSLHLAGCRFVTDGLLFSLSRNCKNLVELGLQGCTNISDSGLADLVNGCQHIRFLDINKCSNVGDVGISKVAECKNLEALDIGCCEEVTDTAFEDLRNGEIEFSLKVLKISNCPKITVSGINMLLNQCSSLEYLDVRSCPHVTKAGCDEAGLVFPEYCKVNFTGSLSEPDVLV
ncbi:hypothetical protein V6Z11_A12G156500 [Gossypium hirsutum]